MGDIFDGFSRQVDDKEDMFKGFSRDVGGVDPVEDSSSVEPIPTVRSENEQDLGENVFAGFSRGTDSTVPFVEGTDPVSPLDFAKGLVKEVPGPLAYGAIAALPAIAMQHMTVASQKIQQKLGIVPKMTPKEQAAFGEEVAYNIQTLGGLLEPKTEGGRAALGIVTKPFELVNTFAHWATSGIDKDKHPNAHNIAASGVELITMGAIHPVGKGMVKLAKLRNKIPKLKGKKKQAVVVEAAKTKAGILDNIETAIREGKADHIIKPTEKGAIVTGRKTQKQINKEQKTWAKRQQQIQAELQKNIPEPVHPLEPLKYPEKPIYSGVKAKTAVEQAMIRKPILPFEKPAQIDPITGRVSEGKVFKVSDTGEVAIVPEVVKPTEVIDPIMQQRNIQAQLAKGIQPEKVPLDPLTYPTKPLRTGKVAQTAMERAAELEGLRPGVKEPTVITPEPFTGVKPPSKQIKGVKHVTEELVPRKVFKITKEGVVPVKDVSAIAEYKVMPDGATVLTKHIPTQRSVFQIIKKPKKSDPKPVQLDMLEGVISSAMGKVKRLGDFKKDFEPVAYEKLKPSQRGVQTIFKELFDRDVIFFDSENPGSHRIRGFIDESAPGQIFINAKANRPSLNIAAHELMHSMETARPELFNWMKGELDGLIKQEGYKSFLKEKEYYTKQGKDPGKEFYPEMMSEVMNKKSFWDQMLAKDRPKALRIMDWLVNLLSRIKNFTRKEGLETYFKDVDKVISTMAKASKEIKEKVKGLETPSEKGLLMDMVERSDLERIRDINKAASDAGI